MWGRCVTSKIQCWTAWSVIVAVTPAATAAAPVAPAAQTSDALDDDTGVLASPGRPSEPDAPTDRARYRALARIEARRAGLPFDLVDAVMSIESGYRPGMIGGVGEIGLMQVRPATAAMMGFKGGPDALADPAVNIHYGATYLGEAWHLAKGNVCRALMKYRAGHGEETMSALSATYCARAKAHLVDIGSPLATTITAADLVAVSTPAILETARLTPGRPPQALPSLRTSSGRPKTGQAFWAAFQVRIKRANAKVEAKWARRVASR